MSPWRGRGRLLPVVVLLLAAGAPAWAQQDDDVVDPGDHRAAPPPPADDDADVAEPGVDALEEEVAEEDERPRRRARRDDVEEGGRSPALTRDPKVLALLSGLGTGVTTLVVHVLMTFGLGYLVWLLPWLGVCSGGALGGVAAWLLAALVAHRRVPLGRLALTTALTGAGVSALVWGLTLVASVAVVAIPLVGAAFLWMSAPEVGWVAFSIAYLGVYAVPPLYVVGSALGAISAALAAGVAGGVTAMLTGRPLEDGEDLLNFDLFDVPPPDDVGDDG